MKHLDVEKYAGARQNEVWVFGGLVPALADACIELEVRACVDADYPIALDRIAMRSDIL